MDADTDENVLDTPVVIDGGQLEGGGQVVRVAMAISSVTRRTCTINNIRAGRPRPGLAAQHMAGVELVAVLCHGALKGTGGNKRGRDDESSGKVGKGSVEFTHELSRLDEIRDNGACAHTPLVAPLQHCTKRTHWEVDVGTAGAIPLVLQAAMPWLSQKSRLHHLGVKPPCLSAERKPWCSVLALRGGTDVPFAPTIDYLRYVLWPVISESWVRHSTSCEVDMKFEVLKRGFYPKGGGKVRVSTSHLQEPEYKKRISLTRATDNKPEDWRITVHVTSTEHEVLHLNKICLNAFLHASDKATSMKDSSEFKHGEVDTAEECRKAGEKGASVTMSATHLWNESPVHFGVSRVVDVKKGEKLEDAATSAAEELAALIDSGATVDDHMLDQLVVYMALGAGGEVLARAPLSMHAKTAMAVCEQMMPWVKFKTTEQSSSLVMVTCDVGSKPYDRTS
jgi:RNA 3'-terminal phosphate cyclase (ATP)